MFAVMLRCEISPTIVAMANHDDAASSSSSFIYDVFLSFRGYTRYGFTDCLYCALTKKGIKTFRDNEDLRVGDEIRPTLVDAIEKSMMSIVVLCQNYASSTWCLDEIVKIMECSENGRKRRVLPIFYQVEPSDVRYQKNQYEIAMNKHEGRYGKDSNRMKGWRLALYAVGDLSGQHCTKDMVGCWLWFAACCVVLFAICWFGVLLFLLLAAILYLVNCNELDFWRPCGRHAPKLLL